MAVAGYDGMAAIVAAIKATGGKLDGDKAVAALKGWKFASPRGPIQIDPATRDIIMNEYLSQAAFQNGTRGAEEYRQDRSREGCLQGEQGRSLRASNGVPIID